MLPEEEPIESEVDATSCRYKALYKQVREDIRLLCPRLLSPTLLRARVLRARVLRARVLRARCRLRLRAGSPSQEESVGSQVRTKVPSDET